MFASCSKSGEAINEASNAPAERGIGFSAEASDKFVSGEDSPDRKVVKNYSVSAETKTFETAISELEARIVADDGYVESSKVNNYSYERSYGDYRRATYTVRVPADKSDAFVSALSGMMNVTTSSSSVSDVTDQYYTLEATLEELIAERESLLAILSSINAKEDYNYWLTIDSKLSEVKTGIAVCQRRMLDYNNMISYSTIQLSLVEVAEEGASENKEPAGVRLKDAFIDSWVDFGHGFVEFFIWLVGAVPTLLVIAGVITLLVFFFRLIFRKKK